MPADRTLEPPLQRWRASTARVGWLLVCLLALAFPATRANAAPEPAGWQSFRDLLPSWSARAPDYEAEARAIVARLTLNPPALALAARVSAEGHWTFTNASGQDFTAANPREMARVNEMLAPAQRPHGPIGPVVLYVPAPSVIDHGRHLKLLPPTARIRIVTGGESYPLKVVGAGNGEQAWFAEVSANVFVRADHVRAFDETVWQLRRPVGTRSIRILSLEPGGPVALSPRPPKAGSGRPAIEPIEPESLADAIGALSGQIAVVTGRLEGVDGLVYRTPAGAERRIGLAPLRAAAAAADADLIVLNATAPRQPGARNWLWLRVDVDNLFEALERPTLGRFMNALAGDQGRLFVTVRTIGETRIALSIVPLAQARGEEPGTVANLLAELVSEVAGTVLPHAVEADLVARPRLLELSHRIIPAVPSLVQHVYLGLLLAGLVALPVALSWWRWLWPGEERSEYAGPSGYWAATAVRWTLFILVFLPFIGLPALIWGLLRQGLRFDRRRRTESRAPEPAAHDGTRG